MNRKQTIGIEKAKAVMNESWNLNRGFWCPRTSTTVTEGGAR